MMFESGQPDSQLGEIADYEARLQEQAANFAAALAHMEASRDQYQEWAIDYERRIAKAKAILQNPKEGEFCEVIIRAALEALEGK